MIKIMNLTLYFFWFALGMKYMLNEGKRLRSKDRVGWSIYTVTVVYKSLFVES